MIIITIIIISGPKRYDVIDGRWRYSHDGTALHDLLSTEFSDTLGTTIDLSHFMYNGFCHVASLVLLVNYMTYIMEIANWAGAIPYCQPSCSLA